MIVHADDVDESSGHKAAGKFLLARNPDLKSSLPYLVCLPLAGGPVWLKARDSWPRTTRVYCQLIEAPQTSLDVLERIAVTVCERRGKAIDLVLGRSLNRRSQFVFLRSGTRSWIFWQTPKSILNAKPGMRIPVSRSNTSPTIFIDTRERYGYLFSAYKARTQRKALVVGDYAIMTGDQIDGVVERKSLTDFVACLSDGSIMFAMAELNSCPISAIAVEGTYSALLRHAFTRKGFLVDSLTKLQVRYPKVSIEFLETKKLAEDWTFRFLCAVSDNKVAPLLFDSFASEDQA